MPLIWPIAAGIVGLAPSAAGRPRSSACWRHGWPRRRRRRAPCRCRSHSGVSAFSDSPSALIVCRSLMPMIMMAISKLFLADLVDRGLAPVEEIGPHEARRADALVDHHDVGIFCVVAVERLGEIDRQRVAEHGEPGGRRRLLDRRLTGAGSAAFLGFFTTAPAAASSLWSPRRTACRTASCASS